MGAERKEAADIKEGPRHRRASLSGDEDLSINFLIAKGAG